MGTGDFEDASQIPPIATRLQRVRAAREDSDRETTRELAAVPYRFGEVRHRETPCVLIPRHSSEDRPYLPFELVSAQTIVGDSAITLPNFEMFEIALFASKLHLTWIATVCGQLETRYRYSNTLGWNTFPVPRLTEQNKEHLADCAQGILLARESHFPKTIAELYDPEMMPDDLRAAHEANDEVLERIYIGRRFRNDTERLEKLFDMYTKMIATPAVSAKSAVKRARRATA